MRIEKIVRKSNHKDQLGLSFKKISNKQRKRISIEGLDIVSKFMIHTI